MTDSKLELERYQSMRHTLICTVGTSLINKLKNHPEINSHNEQQICLWLLEQDNTHQDCGAEINSITRICQKALLGERIRLIFLVSDTELGQKTGQILKLYYQHHSNPLPFKQVEFRVVKGLRDDDVKAFKYQGLKNLVREITKEVRNFSPEAIAINATGGYKAQISFAGMIGQALGIPVYYLFERFAEVIELPPQPIALDLAFWLNNYDFFSYLETAEIVEQKSLAELNFDLSNELFNSLLEQESPYVSLSAMGVLFHERSRLQFAQQETTLLSLIPVTDLRAEAKPISLRDDHGKDILQAFSEKLCRSPYVKGIINSLPFNPRLQHPIRRVYPDGKIEFVLTWEDAGYGVCIQTTGRNQAETNTIAIHLESNYRG